MAIKYYERYPQRWESPSQDYPQGAFKNLSALGEQDGSYLEASWLNDQSGFFGALLRNAEMTPNGLVDTAQKSQFYDALLVCARKAVNLSNYYTKAQVDSEIQDNKTVVASDWGDRLDVTLSQAFLTKNRIPTFKTLNEVRLSVVDHAIIYIEHHSLERKVGGGIYLKQATGVDNDGSIVQSLNGSIYKISKEHLHARTFGIVGDNVTPNDTQMKNLLDYVALVPYFERHIIFNNGAYVFKEPIKLDTEHLNTQIMGIGGSMTTRLLCKDETDDRPFVDCEAEMIRFKGLRLGYLNTKPNSGTTAKPCFKFYKDIGVAIDIDATVEDCYVYGFNRACEHKGRGLLWQMNTTALCFEGIYLDFPNEGEFPAHTDNRNDYDKAWRGIRIINNRSHSITSNFVNNTGNNSSVLRGLEYVNNLMDLGSSFYSGHLGVDARVTNITCINAGSYTAQITGGKNFILSDLVLNCDSTRRTTYGLRLTGELHGTVNNIRVDNCDKSGIFLTSLMNSNITFSNITLEKSNDALGSTIEINSGSNSTIIANNIVCHAQNRSSIHNASTNSTLVVTASNLTGGLSATTGAGRVNALTFRGNVLIPTAENISLGRGSNRFENIYLTNAPNVLSDINSKKEVSYDFDKLIEVMAKVKYCSYKLNSGDGKIHFGIIAQDLKQAFIDVGLDPYAYGVLCSDFVNGEEVLSIRYQELAILEAVYNRHLVK